MSRYVEQTREDKPELEHTREITKCCSISGLIRVSGKAISNEKRKNKQPKLT